MAGRKRKNRFEFLTRKFPVRMQRKLVMLFMAVILAFVVLIGRITYINVTKGSKYTKKVLDQEMIGGGTTVLFVSHSISQIRKLCDRVIWLEHGKMIMDGEPEEVCNKYLQSQKEK